MHKVFLFDNTRKSQPQYWINFVEHYRKIQPAFGIVVEPMNEVLKEFNARFETDNPRPPYGRRWLVFDDEKFHTMFILRWL